MKQFNKPNKTKTTSQQKGEGSEDEQQTNTKAHVKNMGLKPKQNRRPNNAKQPESAGKIIFSYIQPRALRPTQKEHTNTRPKKSNNMRKMDKHINDVPSIY